MTLNGLTKVRGCHHPKDKWVAHGKMLPIACAVQEQSNLQMIGVKEREVLRDREKFVKMTMEISGQREVEFRNPTYKCNCQN